MKKLVFILLVLSVSLVAMSLDYVFLSSDLTGKLSGRISFPFIYGSKDEPNPMFFNALILNDIQEFLEENYSLVQGPDTSWPEVIITPFVGYFSDNFISLYMDYFNFSFGQAHPLTIRKTYNFDLSTNRKVSISKFLGENSQSTIDYIISTINEEIQKDEKNIYFKEATVEMIDDYYISNDELVVVFQLYEIAPYVSGIREFKFSLAELGIEWLNFGIIL